jgi:hypothetical protein
LFTIQPSFLSIVKRYGKYGRKVSWIVKKMEIWKKSKLNSEKKGKLNSEKVHLSFHYSTYFSSIFPYLFTIQPSFLSYVPYLFTIQLTFLPYFPWKYGRKVSWTVKKYGRNVSWIVKR